MINFTKYCLAVDLYSANLPSSTINFFVNVLPGRQIRIIILNDQSEIHLNLSHKYNNLIVKTKTILYKKGMQQLKFRLLDYIK